MLALLFLLFPGVQAGAQEPPPAVLDGKGPQLVRQHLEGMVRAAAARPLPADARAHRARNAADRVLLMRALGLENLSSANPLQARITGTLQRDGYRIEKLVYLSLPGFHVTAHLYVPEGHGSGPFPVIVNPHGHWPHKKAEPVVQTRAIAQARAGYLAMVVDSPGHSFEGDRPVERRWQGSHNDWALALSTGGVTGFYVWDLMRGLDYLEGRADADMHRVGITGASGGGLTTLYAFAADPRFRCAVPVVYASSLEVNPHNGCLCNHVPGALKLGDRADVLALRAPAPVLVIGASEDREFPAEGTRRTGHKLRALYQLHGAAEHARWQVFDSQHDYNQPMREQAMGFFDEFLRGRGDGSPVMEPAITPADPLDPELAVLAETPPQVRSMRDHARSRLHYGGRGGWEDSVIQNGGLPALSEMRGEVLQRTPFGVDGRSNALRIGTRVGPDLAALLFQPEAVPRAFLILVAEGGKNAAANEFEIATLVADGYACLALDVRGFGELEGLDPRLRAYLGVAAPFLMAQDVVAAADAVAPSEVPWAVLGRGACASQVALMASLMQPRFTFVVGLEGLRSYEEAFEQAQRPAALQPGAVYGASLANLRMAVQVAALWHNSGDDPPDWKSALGAVFPSGGGLAQARRNALDAQEALQRCRLFVSGWMAHADPLSGLIPTNFSGGKDLWTAANSAADNYPFMVLTAALTDRELLAGSMLEMLNTERRLTTRPSGLPDDWSFSREAFRHDQPNLSRMQFGASEYVKDGLLPLTEWLGPSPWSARMIELIEAIWASAEHPTAAGLVPTDNVEVHGEMLQTLSRVYWMTGEHKYLEWALRLGDHYLLGEDNPLRSDRVLRLRDHGCEVISGLCELYTTLHFVMPAKKEEYRAPLHELLDRILDIGLNEDGLFVDQVHPISGEQRLFSGRGAKATDTFGYTLNGYYAVYLVDGDEDYRQAVRKALSVLWRGYRSHPWEGSSSDGYADAIESALNLYNREPVASCARWLDSEIRVMWSKQQADGVIEGWHGDGNFARTSLMYALWKTQGVTARPWRSDLRLGAVREGEVLHLTLEADAPWSGQLHFDTARHRTHLHMPLDWPRINQFPEWFVVDADKRYQVEPTRDSAGEVRSGDQLAAGWQLHLEAGDLMTLRVQEVD